ncbi:hypothetical protein FRC03_008876 [Tulasnella sp. 419]|nr:hypothetical protein FRC03_008876 [Tulasnella sp. 419]
MQLQKEAIELMPHHPQRAASDENYARLLMISYQQRGTCDDLEEARMLNHKLLDLRSPGHKERPTSLMDLGNCLIAHFRRDGDKKSLDNAIGYYQEAVRLLKEAHIYPSGALNNLGGALQYRFQLTGDSNDLNGALDSLQEAIKHETLHSQRSTRISNLSIISVNKYLHTGDFGHIEAAILGSRGAREYIFSDHPHRFTTLCNLAVILLFRYQRLWDYTDLEEAIQHLHEALGLVPKDHAARLDALSILAPSLLDRFKNAQSSDSQDLNNSIKYNREVLDLRSPRDIYRIHTLHNLAVCLVTQYELYGDQKSLREAIQHHQSALELQPPGHPHRYRSHIHLASSLLLLQNLEKTSLNPTLSNAIDHYNSALELLPENHPERAEVMAGLAAAYINHESSTIPHQIRLGKVVELFEAAVEHPTADVATRLRIAHQWANTAGLDEASVLRALQKCIELFDRFTLIRPSVGARLKMHGFLRQPTNFASDAASYALQLEQVETAVECLEQGRSLLWSQLGRYRVSLSKLKRADSRLAEEFTRLSTLLERASLTALPDNLPWLSKEEMAIHYRKTSEEWDSVVEQIKMHPGFEHFLKIAPFTALQQASAGGPVVMINIGALRSDAIIIRKDGEPIVVRLRNSSPKDIDILAFQFSGALSPLATERSRNRTIQGILQVLWEDIVDPVVSELQKIGLPHGARIWWCPTHKLSYLPLHAAGPYIRAKRNLPDLYISSYTPTLSSLIRSLGLGSDLQRDKNIPELLLIAQPKGSDQMLPEKDLTKVLEEVHTINRLLPSVNMLRNEEATYEAVVNGLKGHQWVHFACHGTQRLTDPFQSYFHLHQSSLRLLDIIQQQIPIAEFAYTAACHSAAVDKKTPDEIIHLAAGLQFSGFKSVIGTLYPMADDDGPAVAEAVYKHVFYDGENLKSKVDYRDAATALNLAATKLRDRGTPLFRWINFVHIGA